LLLWAAGAFEDENVAVLEATFANFGRLNGCDEVEIRGRMGWEAETEESWICAKRVDMDPENSECSGELGGVRVMSSGSQPQTQTTTQEVVARTEATHESVAMPGVTQFARVGSTALPRNDDCGVRS